jgi:predicted nucleotidyltransferase
VDEKRCRTLARLDATAKAQGLEILLLGAFARDILFWHSHGVECRRNTMDVDIVVQLKTWDAFHTFRTALLAVGFTDVTKNHPEKLRDTKTDVEIDLLPFGEIAEDGKTVVWPEDNSRWSVVGIQDAFAHALLIEIAVVGEPLKLRCVSAPALVLLKIVAVNDRPEARYKKDAADIGFVIEQYLEIGNRSRLQIPPHDDILNKVDADLNRATACLLGRDMSVMVSASTKAHVVDLLSKEVASKSPCRFTQGLQRSLRSNKFAEARTIVRDLLDGLKWRS